MTAIAVGTPCYLARLEEFPDLAGRVVEVVGPMPAPDGDRGQWYEVRAEWALQMFPGRDTGAARRNLIPIVPPEPEAIQRTSEIVPT